MEGGERRVVMPAEDDPASLASTDRARLSPIVVIQDRHGGSYSGGEWLAVSVADRLENGAYRVVRCLEEGPGGSAPEAQLFWSDPPRWIAVGRTPDEALEVLVAQCVDRDETVLGELDRRIAEGTADLNAGRVHTVEEVRQFLEARFSRDLDAAE